MKNRLRKSTILRRFLAKNHLRMVPFSKTIFYETVVESENFL